MGKTKKEKVEFYYRCSLCLKQKKITQRGWEQPKSPICRRRQEDKTLHGAMKFLFCKPK